MDTDTLKEILKDQGPTFVLTALFIWQIGPKLIEYLGKKKDIDTTRYSSALTSLQEYSNLLTARLEKLEVEVESWKNKYYELYSMYIELKEQQRTIIRDTDSKKK